VKGYLDQIILGKWTNQLEKKQERVFLLKVYFEDMEGGLLVDVFLLFCEIFIHCLFPEIAQFPNHSLMSMIKNTERIVEQDAFAEIESNTAFSVIQAWLIFLICKKF